MLALTLFCYQETSKWVVLISLKQEGMQIAKIKILYLQSSNLAYTLSFILYKKNQLLDLNYFVYFVIYLKL